MPKPYNPLVSIIIPVYNGSNYMREAIDSALNQTYKNIEVVVVNDGSTDNTEKIAKSYGDRIRYYKKKNGGVASALNMAIKKSNGEYISWLSHDDVYYPDKVEKQVEVLRGVKNVALVYSDIEYIDENGITTDSTNYLKNHSLKQLNNGLYPFFNGLLNGCSMLLLKKSLIDAGLFDSSLKTANDYEMWYRLLRVYETKYLNIVGVKYRLHSGQSTHQILEHKDESDRFWTKAIKITRDDEILKFSDSLKQFYLRVLLKMDRSGYVRASTLALKKFNEIKITQMSREQEDNLIDYMLREIIEREKRIQEQHRIMKLKTDKINKQANSLSDLKAELDTIKGSRKYRFLKLLSPKAIIDRLKAI